MNKRGQSPLSLPDRAPLVTQGILVREAIDPTPLPQPEGGIAPALVARQVIGHRPAHRASAREMFSRPQTASSALVFWSGISTIVRITSPYDVIILHVQTISLLNRVTKQPN